MRRVFPLRPSETSLLVSYDNCAYEHEDAAAEISSSGRPCYVKGSSLQGSHRRRSSINLSVTFHDGNSSPHQATSQKFPSSVCAEFGEVASLSPRSSVWTGSFRDDGDSTSFNFSDGTHIRGMSSVSSSSSSSITYDPRGSASFHASQDVDVAFDTANSSYKDVDNHIGTEFATCIDSISHDAEPQTATVSNVSRIEPSSRLLQASNSETSRQCGTVNHVAPQKLRENMHVQTDICTDSRLGSLMTSPPNVAAKSVESSRSRSHLLRSQESLSSPHGSPTSSKAFSCSTPFKFLTKCLRMNVSPQKGQSNSVRISSPAKFSTLMNQLYAGESLSQGKGSSKQARTAGEKEYMREDVPAMKDLCPSTSKSLFRHGIDLHDFDAGSMASEDWQSCGADMVYDYVRNVDEAGKSLSFHHGPESSSFHHDSDFVFLMECKRRSYSMDLGKPNYNHSYKMVANHKHLDHNDCDTPSDLFAAEEKSAKDLALLRLEISKLCKDKSLLAKELAAQIKSRQCVQKGAENAVKHLETIMEERLTSMEKDHAHVQSCLEKEMNRRKKEWSAKLEKIGLEEKRLRERVTEMALEKVEFQKCIAIYKGREASLRSQAKDHESSAQAWMQRHHQCEEEVRLLRQSFMTVSSRMSEKEHELDLVVQRSKVLERENAELLKVFSRLGVVYADQETMFEELWGRLVDIVNGASDCRVDSLRKLHAELKVFCAREQALRHEIGVLQSQLFHTQQKNGVATIKDVLQGHRTCSPSQYPSLAKKSSVQHFNDFASETLDGLVKKLEWTKQHKSRGECQLEVKEEEVELLHSTLKERDHSLKELQEELISVKAQRDGLRKQVQQMGQEALKLTFELSELRKAVEKLDEELMLKEGQISILRETCSDGDF